MQEDPMPKFAQFFATRWGIIGVGGFIGVFAQLLQKWGNPANMGWSLCTSYACHSGGGNYQVYTRSTQKF
jgi:hypothetical protein